MNDSTTKPETAGNPQLDRVDELLSSYFDDDLTPDQVSELNKLIAADPTARERTVEIAQLHADLHAFFQDEKQPVAAALPLTPGLAPCDQPIG